MDGGDLSLSPNARRNGVGVGSGQCCDFCCLHTCETCTSARCFTLTRDKYAPVECSYAQVVSEWRKSNIVNGKGVNRDLVVARHKVQP